MDRTMRNHVEQLGRHGAYVLTTAGKRALSGAFYDIVVRFCIANGINCLGYDMKIPETDEPMMIAIWQNGHVDSGSAEQIRAIMKQEVFA